MPEGTFGGDLIGITGRVMLGEGGEETFHYRHVFHKLCNMYTQSHRLSLQDIFSGSSAMQDFFFQFLLCMIFFVCFCTTPPLPPFSLSNGASLRNVYSPVIAGVKICM